LYASGKSPLISTVPHFVRNIINFKTYQQKIFLKTTQCETGVQQQLFHVNNVATALSFQTGPFNHVAMLCTF
jgi:hypothetical protein